MTSYESPEGGSSKIRVGIQESGYLFATDSVQIYVAVRHDQEHGAMVHIEDDGRFSLRAYDGAVVRNPTMTLPRDFAFALYLALHSHFQGEGDGRMIRSDLLHERKRVDQMITALIDIADKGHR